VRSRAIVRQHEEEAVIRRDVLQEEPDQRGVKWYLVAAAFALSLGCIAEVVGPRHDVAHDKPVDTAIAATARMAM
jgi:hypothetical protein